MKKQRKLRGLQRKKMVAGYLFIMPFILGFLAFMVKPFLQSLYMSFCNVEISSTGFHMIFAGMANYIRAFTIDTEFNRLLVEEIAKMTYNSLAIMIVVRAYKTRNGVEKMKEVQLPLIVNGSVLDDLRTRIRYHQ